MASHPTCWHNRCERESAQANRAERENFLDFMYHPNRQFRFLMLILAAVHDDVQQLVNGVQIVVGTPGRVCDMISRGVLRLKAVKLFVLDEADEMLYSRVMREQIYDCFQYLPSE
eukprot:1088632_1